MTVLFVDIVGFTTLAGALDPEQARDLVNACFEQLAPVVKEFGGTVDKFIGDSIMALFGAPVAHENDPERALRCALAMREALAAFNQEHATKIEIHFGVNTGLVVAGVVGGGDRLQYSVMGDAVNVASRLEDAATAGEILVGPATHRLTRRLFEFQALGELKLKGRNEPLHAYKLLKERESGSDTRESRGTSSQFVGREVEIATLMGCIERLQEGQGGLVSIVAEAGIGKSRLMAEARRQTAGQSLNWLEGHALSSGQASSYLPFVEIIQSAAGITADDDQTARWAKLAQRLRVLFPTDVAEVLPYLATLLALEVPPDLAERVRYLDGDAMGRQVFRTARRFFTRLAEERPLVLVFEEVHLMDESSMLLLEHLGPSVRDLPILICGIGRPDPDAPSARLLQAAQQEYADCYVAIRLSPMSYAECTQLVQNLVGKSDLSFSLREEIIRKTEGNPFFIEEIVRALIDFGGLAPNRASGRLQAAGQGEGFTIPDTLQGVIMARIDRLEEEVKQTVKVASVIGRNFFFRVLEGLTEVDGKLDRDLDELMRLQIVSEKSRHPELEYTFKHALMQTAAYESVLVQRRRALHGRVGECMEKLFADRLDEFYGPLAYHFTMAEDWGRAQYYLAKAGDQAGMLAADAEALIHYQKAMEAFVRASGDQLDSLQLAVLERKIGEALFRRSQHEEAREHLNRALVSLASPYPATNLGIRLAICWQVIRRGAHWLLSRALGEESNQPALDASERSRIYWDLIWIDYFNEPERLLLDNLLMWDTAQRNGLVVDIVYGHTTAAVICDAIPLPRLAAYLHSRAVALAERTEQPAALGQSYMGMALHEHYGSGRWDAAVAHYNRAASEFWIAGDLRRWAATSAMLAVLLAQRGEIASSIELCRKIVSVGEDTGDQETWAWGTATQAVPLDEAGAIEQAVTQLRPITVLLEDLTDYRSAVGTRGTLTRCYLRLGKLPEAMAVLQESRRLIVEHRLRGFMSASSWVTNAQAFLLAAEQAGERERPAAIREAQRACRKALREGRFNCSTLATAYRLKGSCDWLGGKPRGARRWWERGLLLAEKLGARYEVGATHLEIGRRTGDGNHLRLAEAIFAEMGAQFDLEQARILIRD